MNVEGPRGRSTVNAVRDELQISYPGANRLVSLLVSQGLLKEITAQGCNRVFVYAPYLGQSLDGPVIER